jgi:hypothetical protein
VSVKGDRLAIRQSWAVPAKVYFYCRKGQMKVESSSRRRQNLSISEEGDLSVVVEAKETLRR